MNDLPDNRGKTRSRKRVWIIAGLLVLVPVVPIVIAIAVSSKTVEADTASPFSYQPLAAAPVAPPKPSPKPMAPGRGTLVARIRHATAMRSAPGGV